MSGSGVALLKRVEQNIQAVTELIWNNKKVIIEFYDNQPTLIKLHNCFAHLAIYHIHCTLIKNSKIVCK